MSISQSDRSILRDLARRVANIAAMPQQTEKARLWTTGNDLRPERAMVLADPQKGWEELHAAWLKLECEDEAARGFEHPLRRKILRHEHVPDDFPILDTFEIGIAVTGAGYSDYGLKLGVTQSGEHLGAYHIEPAVKGESDLEKLHFRPIQIDHAATDCRVEAAQELFGDILNVRKVGKMYWRYGLSRVLIHMRGLDQMMLDMYDQPELVHKLMGFLRDDAMREIDLHEEAETVTLNNTADNVTGSGGLSPTTALPGADFDGVPGVRHCLCWGESQETVGVGPAQFDEFVLQYQLPLMKRFGLVDYGCCEPLDSKFDLLIDKIPHLRWLSIAPWADRALAAEKIGDRYVYVYKPNPSRICSPIPDWDAAEQEVRETLDIAKGCAVHLVMKDCHTLCGEPDRITQWAEMAVRVANDMS